MCERIAIINKGNLVVDTTKKLLERIKTKNNFKIKGFQSNISLNYQCKFSIEFNDSYKFSCERPN